AHGRHPEHSHDGVADELLEGAAVALDRDAGDIEVGVHHVAERLRIEPLAERGRAGDVAEEDGDDLALLAGARRGYERGAARVAEARALRVPGPAARADRADV